MARFPLNTRLALRSPVRKRGITGAFVGPSGIVYYLPPGADSNAATNCTQCRVDSAGRMYLAGETFFANVGWTTMLRLLPNLQPDPSFGTGGWWRQLPAGTKLNGSQGMVIQSNGKIVLGGACTTTGNLLQGLVSRVNANGTSDTSFGGTGSVIVAPNGTNNALGFGCAVQSDGKIVLCGSATRTSDGLVVQFATRLNADGTIDTGYGTNGTVLVDCGSTVGAGAAWSCVCDGADKLYMGGSIDNNLTTTLTANAGIGASIATVADGTKIIRSAKATFNPGGGNQQIVTAALVIGNQFQFGPPLIQAHLSGETITSQAHFQTCVRLTVGGALDTAFNGTGYNATKFNVGAVGLTCILDPVSGKPLVAGNSFITAPIITISRYNFDGTLDATWGTAGVAGVPNNGTNAIWFQPDDKLVLAVQPISLGARLTVAGALDNTYGVGGVSAIPGPPSGQRLVPNGVGVLPDGKLFFAGNGITGPTGSAVASSPNGGKPMWAACIQSPAGSNLALVVGKGRLAFPPESRMGSDDSQPRFPLKRSLSRV